MNYLSEHSIKCGNKVLELNIPVVMGILNLTSNSFYDGGKYNSMESIIQRVMEMLHEGASIIDIGALSTRPGSDQASTEVELSRLIEPLRIIRESFPDIIISIDTYRKAVAEAAVAEGADIINDISGGIMDKQMLPFIAKREEAYIMMHMQGTPENMQENPQYTDVTIEVSSFFQQQLSYLESHKKTNVILDPGFGFGKTVEHNFRLLEDLQIFHNLGYPVLAGVSRKSMINKILGTKPENALNGTTIVNTLALMKGANILRVHDVKPAMEAIKIVTFAKNNAHV